MSGIGWRVLFLVAFLPLGLLWLIPQFAQFVIAGLAWLLFGPDEERTKCLMVGGIAGQLARPLEYLMAKAGFTT